MTSFPNILTFISSASYPQLRGSFSKWREIAKHHIFVRAPIPGCIRAIPTTTSGAGAEDRKRRSALFFGCDCRAKGDVLQRSQEPHPLVFSKNDERPYFEPRGRRVLKVGVRTSRVWTGRL